MSLFVDTSVWALALRRDLPSLAVEVRALIRAIEAGETILTTGLVLQEILQGFSGPKGSRTDFGSVFRSTVVGAREDHIRAAELRNRCRRAGVQVGTIDALLAQLCIRHDLTMLAADSDFNHMAGHCSLKLWNEPSQRD